MYNVAYQGISPRPWQNVCNIIGLFTNISSAVLYGNIGLKILYNNVGRDLLHFPRLESKSGKWLWVVLVPAYWVAAWVATASIPQINTWLVMIGAACYLPFTYVFPPFLMLGFRVQRDSRRKEDGFDPATGIVSHADNRLRRWIRGFNQKLRWNLFDMVILLGSSASVILGLYAGISTMVAAYKTSSNFSEWRCESPIA